MGQRFSDEAEALARIRLVAFDLDGTLVRRDGTCSLFTRRVVRRARKSGVHVILATGRTLGAPARLSRYLGLKEPLICSNGAHVVSGPPRADWQFIPIPPDVLPGLVGIIREAGVPFECHVKGKAKVERRFLGSLRSGRWSLRRAALGLLGARLSTSAQVIEDGSSEKLAGQAVKLVVSASKGVAREVASECSSAFPGRVRCVTTVTTYGDALLEIMDSSVNKGQALALVAERLGVPMEECAAVGDGDNDVEMLQSCRVGVAVANASPRLSLAADRFTVSCDQDGAARFLAEVIDALERSSPRGRS